MIKVLQRLILFFLFALLISGCRKNFDAYYAAPSTLGDPIYQTLQKRGNFTHYLALVDRAGYKDILSTTGWFTAFVPNDAAFTKYFTTAGITTDAAISDSLAKGIVKFSLVYDGYTKDQLSIYQVAGLAGGNPGQGFKRKTTYYDGVQQKGDAVHKKVVATNRNNSTPDGVVTTQNYVDGDNNDKYVPYFTDVFLSSSALSASDYNTFYPNATFSGFNVCGGVVVNKDIAASNGVIDEIDQVITPLNSIDQYVRKNANYSEFVKLMDSLAYYNADVVLTQNNFIATGAPDSVYVKSYDGRLAFSINNENYQNPLVPVKVFNNTLSQSASYSIVVPNNAALLAYRQKILAKFGNSFFKTAPNSVIIDYINSLMWPTNLWPSQFSQAFNYELEPPTVSPANFTDKQMLSNGFFYGTNASQQANVFRTVYGVQYLDPATNMTLQAFGFAGLPIKGQITQPAVKNTLFLMSDVVLKANGWIYTPSQIGSTTSPWGYKAATSTSYSYSSTYRDVIYRMFQTGVIPGFDIPSVSGSGIFETINHEFIKYNAGKIQTSGTLDAGVDLNVLKTDATSVNGTVYYVDGMLSYTTNNVGFHLQKLATKYPASYSSFYYFLSTAPISLYNTVTQAITGVGASTDNNYTILVPTNAAITAAIKAGLLPGTKTTGALPTAAPSAVTDLELVRKFLLYHIINGTSLDVDQRTRTDNYTTLLQNDNGSSTFLHVINQPNTMVIVDNQGRTANVINDATSNQLSNRTIIHSIDNYLNY